MKDIFELNRKVCAEIAEGLQGFVRAPDPNAFKFATLNRDSLVATPFSVDTLPYGWLSHTESMVLYNMALVSKGPILEIGSFIGRSTCTIAAGVRDNPLRPIYDVFDLGLPWTFPETDTAVPADVRELARQVGGVPHLLMDGIARRGLSPFINSLMFCDFKNVANARIYSAAFCDACHSKAEIDANVPSMMNLIDKESYLIVFDDLWSMEACDYVSRMIAADKSVCLGGQADNGKSKISIMARGAYSNLPWFT